MSDVNIHANGSWLGDASEEWHKLPTWGKIAGGGVLVLVAGVAYYEYSKGKSVNSAIGAAQVASGQDLSNNGGGMQSPFSQIPSGSSSVPFLPPGVQGIFDGTGSLIGWQPSPAPEPTPTPTPAPVAAKLATPVPALGNGWKIWQGNEGRWWTGTGSSPGKIQVLLNSLFPSGTKFDYTNNKLSATAPNETQSVVGTVVTLPKAAPPPVHKVAQTHPPVAPRVTPKVVKK